MRHTRLTGGIAAAALLTAPAALAATSGSFKGKTDQKRAVTFSVKRGKVLKFEADVLTFCTTQGNNRYETDAIANLPAIRVKGSRFDFVRRNGKKGELLVEIHGQIHGSKATGKLTLRRPDSYYDSSAGMVLFGVCAANDRKFTATRT